MLKSLVNPYRLVLVCLAFIAAPTNWGCASLIVKLDFDVQTTSDGDASISSFNSSSNPLGDHERRLDSNDLSTFGNPLNVKVGDNLFDVQVYRFLSGWLRHFDQYEVLFHSDFQFVPDEPQLELVRPPKLLRIN